MSEDFDVMEMMTGEPKPTPMTSYGIDYSLFRDGGKDSFRDVFDYENFPELIREIVTHLIMLPRADQQVPILCAYLCLPSGVTNQLPVLFSHGTSGCGKSIPATLASYIYNSELLAANSTVAGVRNCIETEKFIGGYERHYCLPWDDINPGLLSKNDYGMFSLIKNGVQRGAKHTMASGEAGKNISFDIYSPKITSSVHLIPAMYEFRELVRRCIVIQHKHFDHWIAGDFSPSYKGETPNDLLYIGDIEWAGINAEFESWWDVGKLMDFRNLKAELKHIRKVDCPRPLWDMSRDLLVTGVVCGYWKDLRAGIDAICAYWAWHIDNIENQVSNLQKILKRFVDEVASETEKRNSMLRQSGMLNAITPVEIDPKELKTYFNSALANGEIEPGTKNKDVNDAMLQLGYRLNQNSAGKSAWMSITG